MMRTKLLSLLIPLALCQLASAQRVYVHGEHGHVYVAGVDHPIPRAEADGHDQTMELAKTFLERCPDVTPTTNKDKADFDVQLNWTPKTRLMSILTGGKLLHKPDQILVSNKDGDIIYSAVARTVGGDVDGACKAITKVYAAQPGTQQQGRAIRPFSEIPQPENNRPLVVASVAKPQDQISDSVHDGVPVNDRSSRVMNTPDSNLNQDKTGASIGASAEGNPLVRHDGITLSHIEPGGPCDLAGLKTGDVLLALNGHYLFTANDVAEELARHKQGETIAIRFRRKSTIYDTSLTLVSQSSASTATVAVGTQF